MIQEHPSWQIMDSSKLDDFLSCRRMYFYSHILGWRSDRPAHDLYFGESYHRGREYQLINGYDDIEEAYQSFLQHYRLEFGPETDEMYRPKNPEAVHVALTKFSLVNYRDLEDNELLINEQTGQPFTEISGSVPIDDNRFIYFRMDSILRRKEDGMVFSWDHKTTQEKYINSRQWEEGFYLSLQNGTYTHCLYCLFPIEQVLGVEFCGTGFAYLSRGSSARPAGYYATLRRVSAFKTPDQMNVWLWNLIDLVNEVEREMDRLSHCSESDEVMQSFPLNPGSCTKYRGCIYHDFCMSWSNPLRRCQEPPLGFVESFWDPREMDTRNKMDLKWR